MLTDLAKSIHEENKAKGFWDAERNVGEMLMLVVSELGEALEAHRTDNFANVEGYKNATSCQSEFEFFAFRNNLKDTFEDEIADSIIRLLDMCGGLNIDIDFHIKEKLNYNKTRPKLHGKKY